MTTAYDMEDLITDRIGSSDHEGNLCSVVLSSVVDRVHMLQFLLIGGKKKTAGDR